MLESLCRRPVGESSQTKARTMNLFIKASALALLVGAPAAFFAGCASDTRDSAGYTSIDATANPYPLDYCIVSDEKFAGSTMKPYEFAYQGQAIKLCCASCLADFKKEPTKYLKKLDEARQAKK